MYALITGASSGIGREMSILLAKNGYDLIIVARREDRLKNLSKKLEHHYGVDVIVKEMDLSKESNCYKLHDDFKDCPIEILINNAGFSPLPTMATYGATKSYVLNLSRAIALNGLMKKEEVIVPSARIKIIATMSKYLPPKIVMPVANWFQTRMKRS